MNPNSTIPVLKDGDFVIYESNSIIKYISAKFNIFKSYNNQSTALTNQWIDWSSLVFGLHCATYTAHTMLLPLEKRNRILASETQKKIYASFEILDKQLQKHQFLLDNDFSLADIPVGCWLHRCVVLDLGFSEYKLLIWLDVFELVIFSNSNALYPNIPWLKKVKPAIKSGKQNKFNNLCIYWPYLLYFRHIMF